MACERFRGAGGGGGSSAKSGGGAMVGLRRSSLKFAMTL